MVTTLFSEGADQFNFYMNKPNKRGFGIIYIRVRVGEYIIRLSTSLKVKQEYWSAKEGRIVIPSSVHGLDRAVLESYEFKLNNLMVVLNDFVVKNIIGIFAHVESNISLEDCVNSLKQYVNITIFNFKNKVHMKQKQQQPISILLKREVYKMRNVKSQNNYLGIVGNFERFLNDSNLEDNIEVINQCTMRNYMAWLQDEKTNISILRGKQCINLIFKLLRDIENSLNIDFHIDNKIIKSYAKEVRTMEERRNNGIALTEEEINKLASIELEGDLKIVRDLFLLQCYCGCRYEDLSLLLDSRNLIEKEGFYYSVFVTQKKQITSTTPLNHPSYYPQAFSLYNDYKDNCNYIDKSSHSCKYNRLLKRVAKLANLDREIEKTNTKGINKYKHNFKIYEKISSHSGRHTFITNCMRYKHLEPNVIKRISGHSDDKLIQQIYTNLLDEDRLNIVHNVNRDINNNNIKVLSNNPNELNIIGIREAQRVLTFLGVEFDNNLGFEELINLIENKHFELIDNYGIKISLLKEIFNLTLPLERRIEMLQVMLKCLNT